MVESIVFDLDDTLVNTSSTILARLSKLIERYPVTEGLMFLYNLISLDDREDILARRYDFAQDFWRDYELLRRSMRPSPIGNIANKVRELSKDGQGRLGILTNNSHNKTKESLKLCNLSESEFSLGISTYDVRGKTKLESDFLLKLAREGYIVYVGDSVGDYLLSKRSRADFIGVCTGLTERQTFLDLGIDKRKIFPSILEVRI